MYKQSWTVVIDICPFKHSRTEYRKLGASIRTLTVMM